MRTVLLVFAKELILPAVVPRTAPARDTVGVGRASRRHCRTAASATQSLPRPQRRQIIRAKQTRVPVGRHQRASQFVGTEGVGASRDDQLAKLLHLAASEVSCLVFRLDGGGYRRDHLRALAQRVEVAEGEVRIMGSKSRLLQTLVANGGANAVPTQGLKVAEREGFEPPIRLPVCRISSAVLSTTQPPLQAIEQTKKI